MTPMESAQVRFVPADSPAGEDGARWLGVAERRRRNGNTGGAMSGLNRLPGGPSTGAPAADLDLSDVRLEKVVRLRVTIASGCYQVSAADLADKLAAAFTGSLELERKN
jgi:hypothetical protein